MSPSCRVPHLVCCVMAAVLPSAFADEGGAPQPTLRVRHEGRVAIPSPTGDAALFWAPDSVDIAPYVVDLKTRTVTHRLHVPKAIRIRQLSFSPDGARVCGSCANESTRVFVCAWNTADGELTHQAELPKSAGYVMAVRFSRDGKAAYVCAGGDVHELTLSNRRFAPLLEGSPQYIMDVTDHKDNDWVGYCNAEFSFGLYDWSRSRRAGHDRAFWQPMRPTSTMQLTSLDYSVDGAVLAVVGYDVQNRSAGYSVLCFDTKSGKELWSTNVDGLVIRLRFVGDAKCVSLEGCDRKVCDRGWLKLMRTDSRTAGIHIDLEDRAMSTAVKCGEHGYVAVGMANGSVLVWDGKEWPTEWENVLSD